MRVGDGDQPDLGHHDSAALSVASAAAAGPTPAGCASTVAGTLGQVGERIYHEAATGSDVAEAVQRVHSSSALASAIESDNANGVGAALRALLLAQIVRIEVLRDGRVLASAGAGAAIAPVRGSIPGTGASFVLSVQSEHSYLQVARQVTGAQILLTNGPAGGAPATRRLGGTIAGPPPASVPTAERSATPGTATRWPRSTAPPTLRERCESRCSCP